MTASTSRSLDNGSPPRRRHFVTARSRPPASMQVPGEALPPDASPASAPVDAAAVTVEKEPTYVRWQRKAKPVEAAPVESAPPEAALAVESTDHEDDWTAVEVRSTEIEGAANEGAPASRRRVKRDEPRAVAAPRKRRAGSSSTTPAPSTPRVSEPSPDAEATFRKTALELVLSDGRETAQRVLDEVVARIRTAASRV